MKNFISGLLILSLAALSVFAAPPNQTVVKTPQDASNGLYQAWRAKNKTKARNFGRAEAVEKLFGVRQRAMKFKGCTKRDEGDYECIYEDKRIDLSVAMIIKIFRSGYRVTSVSFSSEAI
jgi:hypothetical protein